MAAFEPNLGTEPRPKCDPLDRAGRGP